MTSKAKAYVTALTTDSYLPGVLALQRGLRRTKSIYPLLALLSEKVSKEAEQTLQDNGIAVKRVEKIQAPSAGSQEKSHWLETFDKLVVFSLDGYEKVVFIDSDMLILRNLDGLFEKSALSATQAGRSYPGNESWVDLNSGLMVIEPQESALEKLKGVMPEMIEGQKNISDQDVIHACFEWPLSADQVLSESYNVFACYVDYYLKNKGRILGKEKIKIVHFIGKEKPWMKSPLKKVRHVGRLLREGKKYEAIYFIAYVIELSLATILKKTWMNCSSLSMYKTDGISNDKIDMS